MQRTLDAEEEGEERGFEVEDDSRGRFMHGRMGDHVHGVRFECDVCNFRNINKRDVVWGSSRDLNTLRYIRRASLDVMSSREPDTPSDNYNRMMLDWSNATKVLAIGNIFPRMGNPRMEDNVGMGIALIMLNASLRPGVYAGHLQFDTVRKTATWANHAWTAMMRGEDGSVFASDDRTMNTTFSPTRTRWFQRFVLGVKRRMGIVRKQDEALTSESEQVLALLELVIPCGSKPTEMTPRER